MPKEDSLTFKIRVPQKDVEQILLKNVEVEGQIQSQAIRYYTGMTKVGTSYFLEFSVPSPQHRLSELDDKIE